MNRKEKIALLNDLSKGKQNDTWERMKADRQGERLEFVMSKISFPLLDFLAYALVSENQIDENMELVTNFYDKVLRFKNNIEVLEFINDFEAIHKSRIENFVKDHKLQPEDFARRLMKRAK